MPVVLRVGPYRFMFFSSDKDEPPHVHVKRESRQAKFWIGPLVELEYNSGYAPHELNDVRRMTEEHQSLLLEKWYEFFGE